MEVEADAVMKLQHSWQAWKALGSLMARISQSAGEENRKLRKQQIVALHNFASKQINNFNAKRFRKARINKARKTLR
jgi:hypothetical protein